MKKYNIEARVLIPNRLVAKVQLLYLQKGSPESIQKKERNECTNILGNTRRGIQYDNALYTHGIFY